MRFLNNKAWKMCVALILMQVTLLIFNVYREIKRHNQLVNTEKSKVKFYNQTILSRKFEIKIDNQTVVSVKRKVEIDNQKVVSANEFHNNNILLGRHVIKLHNFITHGTCNLPLFPVPLIKEETWQQVDKGKRMYVFSAYYVERRSSVFIIGAKPRSPVNVFCQLWRRVEGEKLFLLEEAAGKITAPHEGFGQKYTSTIFMCPLGSSRMPTHVSLVTKSCESPLNLLIVHNASKTSNYRRRFSVCLSPLNFRYGRAYELVEWIELNRILGAEYFVVYNYSSASNVAKVLEYYTERNMTEVVQWRLPMGVDTFPKTNDPVEINYFGQTAALNDCLFRNKQFSEFVVNLDIDEFIIPHSSETYTWSDIIKQLHRNAAVYMFKNTFFRKDWKRKIIEFSKQRFAKQLHLASLQVFEHESEIFPAKERSKYIARTNNVDLILTHEVPDVFSLTVPENVGLLHHYRDWENPNDKKERVTDLTVLNKFEIILIQNVRKVWKDLVNVKMNIPVI